VTETPHKRYPDRLCFLLNNPVRQRLNPPDRLIFKLGINSEHTVVDFGCGPGFYTIPLARIAGRTIGIDVSSKMLKRISEYAQKEAVAVELLESDGIAIDLEDNCVDLILAIHVYHEITEREKVLGEFLRILKPEGRLAVVERTRGGVLSRRFGAPIMKQQNIIRELALLGFVFHETISNGDDSAIIAKRAR
jgi:ubiquinone/menaquinone biosynthesis C-methylase UbiE